jgi:hypothetical protein
MIQVHFTGLVMLFLHSSRRLVALIGASQKATWPVTDWYNDGFISDRDFSKSLLLL